MVLTFFTDPGLSLLMSLQKKKETCTTLMTQRLSAIKFGDLVLANESSVFENGSELILIVDLSALRVADFLVGHGLNPVQAFLCAFQAKFGCRLQKETRLRMELRKPIK